MKIKNVILFLILIYSTLAFAQKPKNDLEIFEFKDKIKSVKEIYYKAKDSFGIAVKKEKGFNKYSIKNFNRKGYLTKEKTFRNDNTLKQKVIVIFDKKGNKIEISQYDFKKEEPSFREIREFNSQNKVIVLKNFGNHSKLNNITKFIYDKKNNLIEKNIFLPSGVLKTKTLYKYARQKDIVKLQNKYDSDGKLSMKITEYKNPKKINVLYYSNEKPIADNVYLFNDKEQSIGLKTSNLDGTASTYDKLTYNKNGYKSTQVYIEEKYGTTVVEDFYEFYYEFDKHNNWVKKIVLQNETFTLIIERKIEYY